MNAFKRWTSAALTLALALSLSIASALAVPAAEPFADFRIDAADINVPNRTLTIDFCRRDEDGVFRPAERKEYDCKVNRVTGDAGFYIQPNADGVRATVDYLTDLDGDGVYELPDDPDSPMWDALDLQSNLVQGGNTALVSGQTYILSAETLSLQFAEAAQARAQAWGLASFQQTFPLCRVTLHRTDPADGQDYEQLYYLEIYGQILTPPDVSREQWYYSAVEFSLAQGWFSGLEDGLFGPDEPLNRAQLAQVLWTVAGCQPAAAADFSDVSPSDWFCQAVSWCRQEGLIAGYSDGSFRPDTPLTREQLASFLQRYAKYSGSSVYPTGDLSQYSDCESVSSWAYDSVRWAVSNRLLHISDSVLGPGDTVTRAELASALYTYRTSQSFRTLW